MNALTRHDPLTRQARSHRSTRLAGQSVAVVSAAVELVVPIIIASTVAQVLESRRSEPRALVPLLAIVIAAGACAAGRVLVLTRIATTEMYRLRLAVATRLIGLHPRTVENMGIGEGTALYSHYANELEPLLTADVIRRRTAVLTVIGCIALMFGFEWRLALALLAAIVITGSLIGLVLKPVQERSSSGLKALTATAADIGEYLQSIRSATVYGLGENYRRSLRTNLIHVAEAERGVGHAQALVDLIVKTASMLLVLGMGALGMHLVLSGSMPVARLSGFLGALAICFAPAAHYAELIQQVKRARAAEARLEGLPAQPKPVRAASPPPLAPPINRVELTDALLKPSATTAVGPVSFVARQGELVCCVGPSGSGKTTLLSAIAGFVPISSGHISIADRDMTQWDTPTLWRAIAYVEQGTPTLGATVRTFLTPDETHPPDAGRLRALLAAFALETRFGAEGIDAPLERTGTSLSGGERQRLALIRALASDRPLLLLDEPTAHLDAQTEAAVLDIIDQERADRILIVATHSERLAQRADHVVRLVAGAEAPTD